MFDTFTHESRVPAGRRWSTLGTSAAAHVAILVVLAVVSIHASLAPPERVEPMPVFVAPAPVETPAPSRAPAAPRAARTVTAPMRAAPAPTPPPLVPPSVIAPPANTPPPNLASVVGITGAAGFIGDLVNGATSGTSALGAPPPAPAPVRIGGNIAAPALLHQVQPYYPEAARLAHITGTVVLEATVNTSGSVEDVHVIKSAGVFDEPAMRAVRDWRYAPLRLNGTPMPFILTVTVAFDNG